MESSQNRRGYLEVGTEQCGEHQVHRMGIQLLMRILTVSAAPFARTHMAGNTHEAIISHLVQEEEDGMDVEIYRVPNYVKKHSPEDFEPQELFVGFYCHPSLVLDDPMHSDISKLAIAREFCRGPRFNVPPTPTPIDRPIRPEAWTEFVSSFEKELMANARRMYDSLKDCDAPTTEAENWVVILDALFILAYLRFEYSFDDCWNYDFQKVFERSRFVSQRFPLSRDLLMLENQVPMSLLRHGMQYIHKSTMAETPDSMLCSMVECFVMTVYPFNHGVKLDVSSDHLQQHLEGSHRRGADGFLNCKHLLHCVYLAVCGPYNPTSDETSEICGQFLPCWKPRNIGPGDNLPARNRFRIPSATSLRRVGISVKVRDDSLIMKNIKFERQKHKYVLLVPKLIMNDNTAAIFKNLALYEQIRDNGYCPRGDMRTYLYLMSSLLDSAQDVRLLMNRGVIVNQLGSAEAVSKQWNQMCDGLFIPSSPPPYWSDIQDRICELEKSKSNKWFAELEERNFSSMIVFVSFVAFCILFIATVLQTIYSVLSFYKS